MPKSIKFSAIEKVKLLKIKSGRVISPFVFVSPKPLKGLPIVTARNEAVLHISKIASQSLAMTNLQSPFRGLGQM